MSDIAARKVELRQRMRRERAERARQLGVAGRALRNQAMAEQAEKLGIRPGQSLASFMGTRGEPELGVLHRLWWEVGNRVYLPRVEADDRMEMYRVEGMTGLQAGRYGILEPSSEAELGRSFDVLFIPGLAFSADGQRLGQGAGYYDRYLAGLVVRPLCVGVCDDEAYAPGGASVPTEAHDQAMDWVLTDRNLYHCAGAQTDGSRGGV